MTPANFPASPETSAVNKVRLTAMKNWICCWKFGKPCNGGVKEKELGGEMRERQNQILMLDLLVRTSGGSVAPAKLPSGFLSLSKSDRNICKICIPCVEA